MLLLLTGIGSPDHVRWTRRRSSGGRRHFVLPRTPQEPRKYCVCGSRLTHPLGRTRPRLNIRLGCAHEHRTVRCPGRCEGLGDRRRYGGDAAGHRAVRAALQHGVSTLLGYTLLAAGGLALVCAPPGSGSRPGRHRAVRGGIPGGRFRRARRRVPVRGVRRRTGGTPHHHGGGERGHAGRSPPRGPGLGPARHGRGVRAGPRRPGDRLADRRRRRG